MPNQPHSRIAGQVGPEISFDVYSRCLRALTLIKLAWLDTNVEGDRSLLVVFNVTSGLSRPLGWLRGVAAYHGLRLTLLAASKGRATAALCQPTAPDRVPHGGIFGPVLEVEDDDDILSDTLPLGILADWPPIDLPSAEPAQCSPKSTDA